MALNVHSHHTYSSKAGNNNTCTLGKQAQLCLQEELQYHIAGQGFPYRYTEGNVVHRQKKLSKRRRRPQFQKTQG